MLPDEVLDEWRGLDALFVGAVGTPGVPPGVIERGLLLKMRFDLDLYINQRPFTWAPSGIDFVVIRENTEGSYAGEGGVLRKGTPHEVATQGSVNTRRGVERCVRYAFELARSRERKHLTLVHKTNVLTFAGDLWERTFNEVAAEYPDVDTAYNHIDAACIYMVERPAAYDVVVTDNLFGDILTDLAGRGIRGHRVRVVRQPQPRPHRPVDVRARARLGPGHRRPEQGQPRGRHPQRRPHARVPRRGATPPTASGRPAPTPSPSPAPPRRSATSSPSGSPAEPGGAHLAAHQENTMPITPTSKIWMNGELVDWDDAQIHILTHTLHYGMGVFEGIRAYETDQGPAVFRLTEHIERLHRSAQILMMDMPYSVEELVEATKLTVRETGLPSCYIRPIAYYGYGEMGLNTLPCSVDVAIACWPWGAYLGDDAASKGVRMKISSWTRHGHNTMPPASKTTGNYVNSCLAKVEALKAGYDEAIMLNLDGLVSECTGENIFVARGGKLITPPLSAGALEGITQNTVMAIAADFGFEAVEGDLTRSDLYVADEMFVVGTAAEVSAVNSVDDRAIPCPGPMTTAIADEYAPDVRGQVDKYKEWVEHVA